MGIQRLLIAQEENEAHPERWADGNWFRGTAACLAGRIALQLGATPIAPDEEGPMNGYVTHNGVQMHVRDLAIAATGITDSEARALFSAAITLEQQGIWVRQLVADYALTYNDGSPVGASEQTWYDTNGLIAVRCHRRTVSVRNANRWHSSRHATRAAASDYAGDIATCRILTYKHNRRIWEHTV